MRYTPGSGWTMTSSKPRSSMSPASAASRSASDMAQATHVAGLPSNSGCRALASPPAEPTTFGRPRSSSVKETGPRLDATRSRAPPTTATLSGWGPDVPTSARRRPCVVAAPDAFKGTAGAPAIAEAIAAAARSAGWECDVCPLSDGGEGFAEVVAAQRHGAGAWRTTEVTGPLGAPVSARWWQGGDEAVVESAAASGLPLAGGPEGNDPVAATTRGTGELIAAAVAARARRVLVGVGGSATTDGGSGAVEAIEAAGGLGDAEVVVACDVQTAFVDAAEMFGPQKGASPSQVVELRVRLEALAADYRRRYGVDVGALPGAGAAGGMAGGLAALGARLVPGFELVAGLVDLRSRLGRADLVVTGEGRLDASTW